MEWFLQNEVKRLAAESRLQLIQSEKKVRNTIHALTEKIEVCVRAAERSLLQDLQDIVDRQEQKIDNLENTALASLSGDSYKEKSSVNMKPLAFDPSIVTLATNENLDCLLTQCSSLGVVKLESAGAQTDTSTMMFKGLKSHIGTCFDSKNDKENNSYGYVIGRIVAKQILSERLVETEPNVCLEEDYSDIDENSNTMSIDSTEELVARLKESSLRKVGRRRKNIDRKTATLLLKESQSLNDRTQEQEYTNNDSSHEQNDDDSDTDVFKTARSDITCDSANHLKPHKPDNAHVEDLNESRTDDMIHIYDNVGFNLRSSKTNDSFTLQRSISEGSITPNENSTSPRNCRGRKRYKCPIQNSVGETESWNNLENSDVYSDLFVILPCDLFGH